MYTDANIQWHSGMELTPEVFRNLENDLSLRQQITIRAALADGRIGVLPETELRVEGGFVGRTFEMTGLKLTALTPAGSIISVNDDLKYEVTKLMGKDYYLCVGASKTEKHVYERDGVRYESPKYELRMVEADDVEELHGEVMPVKHFTVEKGSLNVDADYILPTLSGGSDIRFENYRDEYVTQLLSLTSHPNMEDGDAKSSIQRLTFRLHAFDIKRQLHDFIDLLQEIELTLRYYILKQLGGALEECPAHPLEVDSEMDKLYDSYNLVRYLKWLGRYITSQREILDKTVVVDKTIDYDKLKAELYDEIYTKVRAELYEQLNNELRTALCEELTNTIMERVNQLVKEELHQQLHEELTNELYDALRSGLYDTLYNDLYASLYKPVEDSRNMFVPLI